MAEYASTNKCVFIARFSCYIFELNHSINSKLQCWCCVTFAFSERCNLFDFKNHVIK